MSDVKKIIVDELYKPARKNFPRRTTLVKSVNDLWQIDLAELLPFAKVNRGMRYILVVIDCCSKYLWTRPVKNKTAAEVTRAMASVLAEGQVPRLLQSDRGREFYNASFQALMRQYNITHYSTFTVTKASIAERVIRTLKERLYKMFDLNGSHRWLAILPDLTAEYNQTVHRTTGLKPADVTAATASEQTALAAIRKNRRVRGSRPVKFNPGDVVRLSRHKMFFEKGFTPSWTTELFRIRAVKTSTVPVTYELEDLAGSPIQGCFYTEELQRTIVPNEYLVEKVLRRRGDQIYVKWLGMDSKSWIPASDVL